MSQFRQESQLLASDYKVKLYQMQSQFRNTFSNLLLSQEQSLDSETRLQINKQIIKSKDTL